MKEALKLALEALEDLGMKHFESTGEVLYKETFNAIKAALAQDDVSYSGNGTAGREADVKPTGFFFQMPEQEPVAWVTKRNVIVDGLWEEKITFSEFDDGGDPVYYTPQQRMPLMDEQIAEIAAQGHQRWLEFARAIEAAHGIKE